MVDNLLREEDGRVANDAELVDADAPHLHIVVVPQDSVPALLGESADVDGVRSDVFERTGRLVKDPEVVDLELAKRIANEFLELVGKDFVVHENPENNKIFKNKVTYIILRLWPKSLEKDLYDGCVEDMMEVLRTAKYIEPILHLIESWIRNPKNLSGSEANAESPSPSQDR